jgi:hypothetical protein
MDEQEKQRQLMLKADAWLLISTAKQAMERARKSNNAGEALANLFWVVEFMLEVVSRMLTDAERNRWIDQLESDANKGADQ